MNESTQSDNRPQSGKVPYNGYLLILLITLIGGIALAYGLTRWTEYQHFEMLDRQGNERLELYASTVQSAKQRFDYLPFIVSRDRQVRALLKGLISGDPVSKKLHSWQTESAAAVLYLMDHQGNVLASSNWQDSQSFVGSNYHFRPYFQDAIQGGQGQFFAVGASTGQPGLFLSRPVWDEETIIGVAVVKIDMTQLETDWALGGENVLVADSDGVIFLASNPEWKYHSLKAIDANILKRLSTERKYSSRIITPLEIHKQRLSPLGHTIIELAASPDQLPRSTNYLMHQRPLSELNWTLYYLTDLKDLVYKKRSANFIALLITLLLALTGFIFINRSQSRRLLEERVARRTQELNETNRRLLKEIDTRIETEEQLRQTHEELVQAEKLAALGQMSAGIVHEISQPLSAMQTFVASSRLLLQRGDNSGAIENLDDIGSMVRRVTSIVTHLKSFASKSRGHTSPVEIQKVLENALLILRPRLDDSTIQLTIEKTPQPLYVIADEIKLEQILINLIRNALDAMQQAVHTAPHQLKIWTETNNGRVHIFIADTGTGINPDDLPKVFDPFFTTKPQGEGLGLGLSVSYGIAKEFGGDLEVVNNADRGSLFKLSLDNAHETGSHHESKQTES
ncbi:ATP-binding protein [Sedimenticola sp.]|uniref:ATP-binding protein n=1 Tax=Sedimenticola sp. TaxID=1940285 RepID=UPI003D1498A7